MAGFLKSPLTPLYKRGEQKCSPLNHFVLEK